MYKYAVIQVVGATLMLAAYESGWIERVLSADSTRMCILISGLALVGLVLQAFKRWDLAGWLAGCLPLLGLCGTVIGFMVAFSDINPANVTDIAKIAPMVTQMLEGMGIALTTTLVGILGFLWLDLTKKLCKG